jgi:hypothetical protein
MRRRTIIGLVGILTVLTVASSAWSSFAPSGPDPVVKEWPAWPYLSQCDGGLPFYAPEVFSGLTEAEKGTKPSEAALREVVGDTSRSSNWRLLAEDEDRAEFVQGRLSTGLAWVSVELRDGAWRYWQSGGCRPTSIVGSGPVVKWRLAEPEAASPNAVVRRIRVDLPPCNNGTPQYSQARPVFREWGRKLLMTIWVKPLSLPPGVLPGCTKLRRRPLKVTLPRRIKLSTLYDGSTYPPFPAVKPGVLATTS